MRKALFFDIDGTLINFQGEMPKGVKEGLLQLKENGHKILLCSGRSLCQITPVLRALPFDGIISGSGSYVESEGKMIFEHHMSREVIMEIKNLLEQAGACYSAQTRDEIIANETNRERMLRRFEKMGVKEENRKILGKTAVVEHIEQRKDIEKIVFFESEIPLSEIQEKLSPYCEVTAMSFENATADAGEISGKGIHKALGIEKYINYMGIAKEDTIAFGDGANDMEMIAYAQIGVAMGNASAELKAKADLVTTDVNDNGLLNAFHELQLL
jgi:Cof subfamily protein (haloacid dehalogenase superfamily)